MAKYVNRPDRITPKVRISYPSVFKPRAFKDSDPKYSVTLMFDKKNKEHMDFLKALSNDATEVLAEKWPDPAKRPRIPVVGHTDSVIKDGDKTTDRQGVPLGEKNPEYLGHYIVRASTKTRKPAVIDTNKQEILDTNEIYGGCFCRALINVYGFDGETNKGVTAGLSALQKMCDGESFGGGPVNLDAFGEVEAEDPLSYRDPGFGATGTDDDIPF